MTFTAPLMQVFAMSGWYMFPITAYFSVRLIALAASKRPTSIIKHPPHIKGSLRLFALELSTCDHQHFIPLGNLRSRWAAH